MSARSQGILVAGMHRSGTSAMSGSLQRLGVALGHHLIPGASDNRSGYFEHAGVVAIHEALFRELGSWWFDPRPLPTGWMQMPAARRAEDALVKLLRDDFSDAALWAVKDPRVCRFLPLWRKVLDRLAMPAAALLVVRAPADVAASLTTRNGFGAELGELLWLRHVIDAVRETDGLPRTVILYEDLVARPRESIDGAFDRLGIAPPASASADALDGFIETKFQHHRSGGSAAASPMSALAGRAFASLCALARNGAGWDVMDAHLLAFDQYWESIGPAMQAMADALFPEIEAKAKLSEEVFAVRAELNGQLRWAQEVVQQHGKLSEEHALSVASLAGEREALQAALAHARSDLTAQVRWAEHTLEQHALTVGSLLEQHALTVGSLAGEREALQAALAHARSDLTAQVRWAEHTLEQHALTVGSLAGEREALQAALAHARSDLTAQVRWAEHTLEQHALTVGSLAGEREALQAALAHARSDLTAQVRWAEQTLEQHRSVLAELHAQIESCRTQAAHDSAAIEVLRLRESELAVIKKSLWWRLARPLRALVHKQ